jgi:hypothetical protein
MDVGTHAPGKPGVRCGGAPPRVNSTEPSGARGRDLTRRRGTLESEKRAFGIQWAWFSPLFAFWGTCRQDGEIRAAHAEGTCAPGGLANSIANRGFERPRARSSGPVLGGHPSTKSRIPDPAQPWRDRTGKL